MLILGNIREGKTLLMVDMLHFVHVQNQYVALPERLPIYANFDLAYDDAKKIDVGDLLDLEGLQRGELGCTEAYTWLESRVSSSNLNRYVSYFLFQSGKRDVAVIADAQLGSSIDLRFFDLAHVIALARKEPEFERFRYDIAVRCGAGVKFAVRYVSYALASTFWNDYDTRMPVAPLGMRSLQFEMERFNTEKVNSHIDRLVGDIMAMKEDYGWFDARSVFRYQVEDWLLRVGEPQACAPLVTNRLKVRLHGLRG
jgi:hypothetical protein